MLDQDGQAGAGSIPAQEAQTVNICDRTSQVEAAILAKVAATDCSLVPASELAAVTTLDLEEESITSLQSGDFAGLTGLTTLVLENNQLTTLPADVFDPLTSLVNLDICLNPWESLPPDVFDNLTSLKKLHLYDTPLESLPAGIFGQLTSLEELLIYNNLSLSEWPAGVFDHLTSLKRLDISVNGLDELPTNMFDHLTSLESLKIRGNSLEELPPGVFDKLTSLEYLSLSGNLLDELPAGVFDKLTSLTTLDLSGNSLDDFPPGVFDKLTSLEGLDMSANGMTALPPGVFDSLTGLTYLDLGNNDLQALPPGVFDQLTSLTTLILHELALAAIGVIDNPDLSYSPYQLSPLISLESLDGESYTRPDAPGAPTGLTGTFVAGNIELSWTAPAEGGAPTSYRILRKEGDAEEEVYVHDTYAPGPVAVAYTDIGITDGETYQYRVKALNTGGASAGSEPAEVLANLSAPVITSLGPFMVDEGVTRVSTLTADDPDTATEHLVWSVPQGEAGGADADKFTLSPAGVLDFRTAKDYEAPDDVNRDGTYEVTVQVSDGENSGTAAIEVTLLNVDEPPVAADDRVTTNEDTAARIDVLANDRDPEGGNLSVLANASPANGAAAVSSGAITYTPDRNFNGRDQFTYTISDGGNTAGATVYVTVKAVNDAPRFPYVTGSRRVAENAPAGTPIGAPVAATDPRRRHADLLSARLRQVFVHYRQRFRSVEDQRDAGIRSAVRLPRHRGRYGRQRGSDSVGVTIAVIDTDGPLAVTGAAMVDYPENGVEAVAVYTAMGLGSAGAEWSLAGDDSDDFSIADGVLSFNNPPDYEAASDLDVDNEYEVTVEATAGSDKGTLDATVTVTDVDLGTPYDLDNNEIIDKGEAIEAGTGLL